MNRKKLDLTRHAPPGYDLKAEKGLFFAGMVLSILYSLFAFGNRFSNHLAELYWINGSTKTLKAGAIMPDFVEILDGTLVGFCAQRMLSGANRSPLCLPLPGEQKHLHHAPSAQPLGAAPPVPDTAGTGGSYLPDHGICYSAYFLCGLYERDPRRLPDPRSVAEDMECVICLKLRM